MVERKTPQLTDFPFQIELQTRFSDLDTLAHINNVAIADLYQESRVQFHREVYRELRVTPNRDKEVATVLADIHISYARETHYPYPVTIGCGVSRLGNKSYTISSAMFQKGQWVGNCDAVLVYVKHGQTVAIPDADRQVLTDYLIQSA